jgi:transcriptional regulator with XRE-family HTH domain
MPCLFGAKVRYLRQQHGMTQAMLAQQLDLASHSHINNVEAGRRASSLDLILRVAHVFGVSTDYFLRDDIPPETATGYQVEQPVQSHLPALFGAKLRHLRARAEMLQLTLTQYLNLASQAYVSNLEAGRKTPSPELVVRIADLFGVTTDYLLRDDVAFEGSDMQDE